MTIADDMTALFNQAVLDGVAVLATYTPSVGAVKQIPVFFKKQHLMIDENVSSYDIYIRALTSDIGNALPGETIAIPADATYKIKDPPRNENNGFPLSIVTLSED